MPRPQLLRPALALLVFTFAGPIGCGDADRVIGDPGDPGYGETGDVDEMMLDGLDEFACAVRDDYRECGEGAFQICSGTYDELTWGPCEAPDTCAPGDTHSIECDTWGDGNIEIVTGGCEVRNGTFVWEEISCPFTPLVLSWSSTMPELQAADGMEAEFAMAGGDCRNADWPTADTPWLAIDLDHDGRIDDASELLGADTFLPGGTLARNGYEALGALDLNEDGRVDARDPAFSQLLAWFDHDGDRQSSPLELVEVSALGIDALSLEVDMTRDCDLRGNCAIGSSPVSSTGTPAHLTDVLLRCR